MLISFLFFFHMNYWVCSLPLWPEVLFVFRNMQLMLNIHSCFSNIWECVIPRTCFVGCSTLVLLDVQSTTHHDAHTAFHTRLHFLWLTGQTTQALISTDWAFFYLLPTVSKQAFPFFNIVVGHGQIRPQFS